MSIREEQRATTRAKLLETATTLFMQEGYDSTSVDQITKHAGVAKGTFFVHFPSKASVLGELGRAQLEKALDIIEGADRMSSWPFDRQVEHVFRTLARTVDQAPELARMWIAWADRDAAAREIRSEQDERLRVILNDLARAGKRSEALRVDVLADRMALFLVGVYESALEQWCDRGGNFERWLMESVRLALDGLRPRG